MKSVERNLFPTRGVLFSNANKLHQIHTPSITWEVLGRRLHLRRDNWALQNNAERVGVAVFWKCTVRISAWTLAFLTGFTRFSSVYPSKLRVNAKIGNSLVHQPSNLTLYCLHDDSVVEQATTSLTTELCCHLYLSSELTWRYNTDWALFSRLS